MAKVVQDICNASVQRSLLVKRESLRANSPADSESFQMTMPRGAVFTATRTYPAVEVEVRHRAGAPMAHLSRQQYVQVRHCSLQLH